MTMKKYADGEGKAEVFTGAEAQVVNEHLAKTGKAVQDFSDDEREAFRHDLEAVREAPEDKPNA